MKVSLPSPLIDYTKGAREVSADGKTINAMLEDLDRQYPGIRFRMINEQGQVRPHIKIFVNALLQHDLTFALAETDEILVVAALSGG